MTMYIPSDLAPNAQNVLLEIERRLAFLERRIDHPEVTREMFSKLGDDMRRDLRAAIGEPTYRDWEEVFGGPVVVSRGGMTLRPISPATVTIEGGLSFTGVLDHTFQSCRAERSASQTIATSLWSAVNLDTETWDSSGFFAASSKVMTVPTGMGGLYLVNYTVRFTANATGQRIAALAINNSADTIDGLIDRRVDLPDPAGTKSTVFGGSTLAQLAAADTVTLKVLQDSGGDLSVVGIAGARGHGTALELVRIGS